MEEKWILTNKRADYRTLSSKLGVSPLLIKLAVNRGYQTEEELRMYFEGDASSFHDPHLLRGADEAAREILACIRAGKRIGIATDYDVDGIFAAYILWRAVRRLGGRAKIYFPDRVSEGYGLNRRIVADAADDDAALLVTCDNGISSAEPVAYANSLGMVTVVTDHHEVPFQDADGKRVYELPPARVVVDPRQPDCPYPFKDLSGAGVIYKLVQILFEGVNVPAEEQKELLSFAAMATVIDVMDLTGENRVLVKEGLKALKEPANAGLGALMAVTGIDPGKISCYHLGYVLGPCFNAAGRLDTAQTALRLLQAKTAEEAYSLARELKDLNDSRKTLTARGEREAVDLVNEEELDQNPVIVVYLPGIHESVAGIVAGRLRERFNRPAFVIVDGENGLKGSGRSVESYSMYEKLSACSDLLTSFGGHPMAAGFSVKEGCLPEFERRIREGAGLSQADLLPVVRVDALSPLGHWSESTIKELDELEPTGKGNPKPLFCETNVLVQRATLMGRTSSALRLDIKNSDGCRMEAVYFGDTAQFQHDIETAYGNGTMGGLFNGLSGPVRLDLVYYPSVNEYRGERRIQIVVEHYRASMTVKKH